MKLFLIFRINFQCNNQGKNKYNYNQKNNSKFFVDDQRHRISIIMI